MKKILLTSLSALFLAVCSCDNGGAVAGAVSEDLDETEVNEVLMTVLPMEEESSDSRLATSEQFQFTWELNDTIGIFPAKGGQVEFPIKPENVGTSSAKFDGGGWALKSSHRYSAYYPFNFFNRDATKVSLTYLGQKQNGTGAQARAHLSDYVCLACAPTTVVNGFVNFSLSHVGSILKLTLTLPEATTYTSLSVFTGAKVLPVRKTINLQDTDVAETVTEWSDRVKLDLENITTTGANQEVVFWMAFPSVDASSHALQVVIYDENGRPYVGNVLQESGEQAKADFWRNYYQRRFASPVLTEGFLFGMEGWGSDGTDHGGSVN